MEVFACLEVNVICFVIIMLLLLRVSKQENRRTTNERLFFILLIFNAILIVSDIISVILYGRPNTFFKIINHFSNVVYYYVLLSLSYCWMLYILNSLKIKKYFVKRVLLIACIPYIIITIMSILSPFYGWFYTIDDAGLFHLGKLDYVFNISCLAYALFADIIVITKFFTSKNRVDRVYIYPLLFFPIFAISFGILQVAYPTYSLTHVGLTLTFLLYYDTRFNSLNKLDSLTKLENRKRYDNYRKVVISKSYQNITLMLFDIDKFKAINDNFGHIVGDKVLEIVASSINDAAEKMTKRTNCYRYGGDEMIVIGKQFDNDDIDRFITLFNRYLNYYTRLINFSFDFTVSIGHASGDVNSEKDYNDIFDAMDIDMYNNKRK